MSTYKSIRLVNNIKKQLYGQNWKKELANLPVEHVETLLTAEPTSGYPSKTGSFEANHNC